MDDHRLNLPRTEQTDQETPRSFHLGVLFIHGIGVQRRGQTLAEFGGPVYSWLKDRLHSLDNRWRKGAIEAIKDNAQPEEGRKQIENWEKWREQIENWATDGFHVEDQGSEDWATPDSRLVSELSKKLNCKTLVGRVVLTDVLIDDPEDPGAPAHADLRFERHRINDGLETERWLLAESWWAETFAPPRFAELARWGLRIIPWTVGSHFGAQVRRVLQQRPEATELRNLWTQTARWLIWVGYLFVSLLALIAGLLASPFLLAVLVMMLLVWLLPIPQVREALLKLQLTIASTLGDSYVLVSRPIEAASIVAQVRRDICWLAGRCKAVAIVAHSQGGAVAHKALQRGVPPNLRLLFTFGSGLKKLEQLNYLVSSGQAYARSAGITLGALLITGFVVTWFWTKSSADLFGDIELTLLMFIYLFFGVVFALAGVLHYIIGIDLPDVRRWIKRLQKMRLEWVDCYGAADPVSNGSLLNDPWVKEFSKEVCNEGSTLRDHNSYWTNRDQFVTLLIECLTHSKLRQRVGLHPAVDLKMDEGHLNWITERRRWRVGILSAIGWIGILSVLLAARQEPQAWLNFFIYLADHIAVWWTRLLGGEAKSANYLAVSWPALGYLVLVLVPYWITRWRWRVWNEVEMRKLIQGSDTSLDELVLGGMCFQLGIAAFLLYEVRLVLVIAPFVIIPALLLVWWMAPSDPDGNKHVITRKPSAPDRIKHLVPHPSSSKAESPIDPVWPHLRKLGSWLRLPLYFAMVGWYCFVLVVNFVGGSILGFRPSEVPSVLAIALLTIVFTLVSALRFRQKAGSEGPGAGDATQ